MAERRADVFSDKDQSRKEDKIITDPKKYLNVTKKGSFKYTGCFESLKRLIDDSLSIETKWWSPGGCCKQYESSALIIRWYTTNNSQTVKALESGDLKAKLNVIADENIDEPNNEENEDTALESITTGEQVIDNNVINLPDASFLSSLPEAYDVLGEKIRFIEEQMVKKITGISNEVQKLKDRDDLYTTLSRD